MRKVQNKKIAFLSMDVEDWYHTGYIQEGKYNIDKNITMLDGVTNFIDILNIFGAKATFFVVAQLCELHFDIINQISNNEMEVACHGLTHINPVDIDTEEYGKQIAKAKLILSDFSKDKQVKGLRAPSYAFDDEHYKKVSENGFLYDSSRIYSDMNSRYGSFDMSGFKKINDHIYVDKNGFTEFVVSTQSFCGKSFPIGGGTFRIFPWWFIRHLLKKYLAKNDTFLFFIHPYELSNKKSPKVKGLNFINKLRFNVGRKSVKPKIIKMIKMLESKGFECRTFSEYLKKESIKENDDGKNA